MEVFIGWHGKLACGVCVVDNEALTLEGEFELHKQHLKARHGADANEMLTVVLHDVEKMGVLCFHVFKFAGFFEFSQEFPHKGISANKTSHALLCHV